MALDPDDRKDQDSPHTFARGDHGCSQPARSRIRRKLDDGAHFNLSAPHAPNGVGAATLKNSHG
jgi:hypothetical protein